MHRLDQALFRHRCAYRVKASWPHKSSINCLWSIGGCQHQHSLITYTTTIPQTLGKWICSFSAHYLNLTSMSVMEGTWASSRPSISVSKVESSFSPTEVSFPLLPLAPPPSPTPLQKSVWRLRSSLISMQEYSMSNVLHMALKSVLNYKLMVLNQIWGF